MSNIYGKYNLPVRFDGDIIITDPCYIMRPRVDKWKNIPSWWDFVSKSKRVEKDGRVFYHTPKPEEYPDCRDKTREDYKDNPYSPNLPDIEYNLEVVIPLSEGKKPKQFSPTLEAEWQAYYEADQKWKEENKDDWEICEYGEDMGRLGFTHSLIASTLYGDWGCTTFNSDTKEIIGQFCADAGLVGVFYLNEVLKYNPEYNDHLRTDGVNSLPWPVTVIKDFHGEVMLETKQSTKTRKHLNKNPNGWDDECRVVGTGNINFISTQTSL